MATATSPPEIRFRPSLESDRAFLFGVYASSRAEELRLVPWTPEQKHAFLAQQFQAQDHDYRARYEGAEFLIILVEEREAGRLYLLRSATEILVMDIALLPGEQGKGIGTRILSDLVAEADRSVRSMSLHVEPSNPALRLYQRLGFRIEEDLGVYLRLGRPPGGAGAATS